MTTTTTTRSGDPGQNFFQETTGEAPNSVEVSLNSKGAAQISIKLYFATPEEATDQAATAVDRILTSLHTKLYDAGIPLAGQEGR